MSTEHWAVDVTTDYEERLPQMKKRPLQLKSVLFEIHNEVKGYLPAAVFVGRTVSMLAALSTLLGETVGS